MAVDTGISDADVVDAMARFGGSFVQALADAYRVGDEVSRGRLRAAFPEYWTKYRDVARLHRDGGRQ